MGTVNDYVCACIFSKNSVGRVNSPAGWANILLLYCVTLLAGRMNCRFAWRDALKMFSTSSTLAERSETLADEKGFRVTARSWRVIDCQSAEPPIPPPRIGVL